MLFIPRAGREQKARRRKAITQPTTCLRTEQRWFKCQWLSAEQSPSSQAWSRQCSVASCSSLTFPALRWMKMGEHRGSGLVRGLKMVITFAFSHLGLCAFVAAYTVAGAFLFRELEQKNILPHYDSSTHRAALLRDLHNITGYGHISPRTRLGKMVTIFYAIIGIPLMLLCLTNIGDAMASSFRFMYRRVCCVCCNRNQEAEEESPLTNPTNSSGSGEAVEPAPYTPPPKYKPSRRNMLISPPISATIHRGSDNPLKPPMLEPPSNPSSKASTPKPPRPLHAQLTLNDIEANRIVAECAAYTKTPVPGMIIPPSPEHSQNECHDYEMLPPTMHVSLPATSRHTPDPSTPSTPLSKDAPPAEWTGPKENGGPHIVIEEHFERLPSNSSTRPGSPALTTSTHHASSMSLAVSSSVSRPWPPSTPGGLMPYANEAEEAPQHIPGRQPPRSPGKTLVVYNTLSGDALLEQSKVARRMALMNKGGFGQARQDATTVFTDPVSGQAVNGDMLGLSYRPIPPDTSDADNRVPIPIVLAFVASYLGVGALLFTWLEGWSLMDAGYFCFITLSTIGFGDFVPGKSLGYETQEAQIKLVTGSLYLMFGLAVLAMSFNLVQEEVVIKCKAFALWIGLMKE
ncbi:hypothetical protein O3P69_008889 [Scylla paramamosain]|uniref:Potassium channel domain-containing protein n=1 Tax=Scylla paramamosain TaxID=85552 RepID=A0AAW0TQQ4_SCYPA